MAAVHKVSREELCRRCLQFCYALIGFFLLVVIAIILPDFIEYHVSRGKVLACENILGVSCGLMFSIVYDRYRNFRGE